MQTRVQTPLAEVKVRSGHGIALLALLLLPLAAAAAPRAFFVSPEGDDAAAGTRSAPFRTLARAQAAARAAARDMQNDVVVNLLPGVYRLDKTLDFTEADSGRNGHHVIYRSAGGPGKARILGSMILKGWKPYRDGIWQVSVPEGMIFHTLYENGRRAWKARFPNYVFHPDFPTARGRYLVSVDGSPESKPGEKTGWLVYRPEDAPPINTPGKTLRIALFSEGRSDWFRIPRKVLSLDPKARRVTFPGHFSWGVKAGARFFFEDDLRLLDAPGEFYLDAPNHTLYYMPLGKGHPDQLHIAAPVVRTLIHIEGRSRTRCVENLRFEGLALEETDGFPKPWWSTGYGLRDAALIWMRNTRNIEIRACHLRNSGRNGIMMVGHNVDNRVAHCWIEHMAVNGVTLSNRFPATKTGPNLDRCEHNRVHDCRIDHVGEVHCYAACVNVFNASYNEIDHCELHDSVRYAVTVRGNTNMQGGPLTWTTLPPAKGNRMHHLRVFRCGQDSGDMGALHCAGVNIPGGDAVNTFEQITVADCRAIPSMHDVPPDGIFLDWPKMSMHQVFRNVHIVRCQGRQLRSNGPDNEASARTENVSWKLDFDEEGMDYEHIGLTDEFPAAFGGRPPVPRPPPAPRHLAAAALAYDRVLLTWEPPPLPADEPRNTLTYAVFRNGVRMARTTALRYEDAGLSEHTTYRYSVAAKVGDFCRFGKRTPEKEVRTPGDDIPPEITGATVLPDRRRVRVAFSEPVTPESAENPANYRFTPPVRVTAAKLLFPEIVMLETEGFPKGGEYTLTARGVQDRSAAHNPCDPARRIPLARGRIIVWYPLRRLSPGVLVDESGAGANARLLGGAVVERGTGPFGGPALYLNGETAYAEAPADRDLGAGDFTIMAWIYREKPGIILSKGNGFGSLRQWSWGWQNVPRSISFRVNNRFLSTARGSVPDLEWVHVAFVKRGSVGRAYVNGKPSGETFDMSGLGPFVNDYPLRIGRRDYKPTPTFFKGRIAGLKVLDYALSPDEIAAAARGPRK